MGCVMRKTDLRAFSSKAVMMQKIIASMLMIMSIILILVTAFLAYMPVKVLDYKQPVKLVNKTGMNCVKKVKPGETLFYRFEYRKYKNLPSRMILQVVNKYTLSYPIYEINLPPSDPRKLEDPDYYDVVLPQFLLPETAMPGKHFIRMTLTYKVSHFREQVYHVESEVFEVEGNGHPVQTNVQTIMLLKPTSEGYKHVDILPVQE